MIRSKRLWSSSGGSSTASIVSSLGVTSNGLVGTVPVGYMLEMVIYLETGGADVTIDLGTSAAGNQISDDDVITASSSNVIQYNYTANGLATFNVYISSAAWTTSSLDVYLLLRKVR